MSPTGPDHGTAPECRTVAALWTRFSVAPRTRSRPMPCAGSWRCGEHPLLSLLGVTQRGKFKLRSLPAGTFSGGLCVLRAAYWRLRPSARIRAV